MSSKLFKNLFYKILSEQDLPQQDSETQSALPAEIQDKTLEVALLTLCKKCLYTNIESFPENKKINIIQLKTKPVTYTNVESILGVLEQLIRSQIPNYQIVFTNEFLNNHNVYNNKEILIDLVKLAIKCLFSDSNSNIPSENKADFSSFLTDKIKDINQENTDEVKKALIDICNTDSIS